MRTQGIATKHGRMTNQLNTHAAHGRMTKRTPIDADEPIHWGCSLKGWKCCVDKGIAVRPYDMVRLRHAVSKPAHEITADRTVTFAWHGPTGALVGSVAHKPYTPGHVACFFYDEVTNRSAAALRDSDPERFAALPPHVQRAADASAANEYRVAGLCSGHLNRPEVCRGFPYQREAHIGGDGPAERGMLRVFECGSCALPTPTTPRQAVGDDVHEYWRANDVFSVVMAYYRSRGAARLEGDGYRTLPIADAELTQLWAAMYLPDNDPTIAEQFPAQWERALDVEGDRAIYARLVTRALDRLDAVVNDRGLHADDLGFPNEPTTARPDLDHLLDPSRQLLTPLRRVA